MSSTAPFEDRWVLVSGAGSGIGRAIAVELSAQGARLILCGRDQVKLLETQALLAISDRSTTMAVDLAQHDKIGPAVVEMSSKVGKIYGLCHCAGVIQMLPLAASSPSRVNAMMSLNFIAGLELCRAVARRDVVQEQGGSILWIASVAGHVGAPGQAGYAASKGAAISAVRSLAAELAPRRIRVNSLSPGVVRTAMTEASNSRLSNEQWAQIEAQHPLGSGAPDDVARAAAFLLDPRNDWITGSDLIVDGGYSLR